MPEQFPQTPNGIEIVEDVSDSFTGEAYKFKTDEPITLFADDDYRETIETQYFAISATVPTMGRAETMVFPAAEDQTEPISWGEIAGGMRTGWDIEGVLQEFADRYL